MAQDETLLGHHYRRRGGEANYRLAIQHYERALQLQADFAPAFAGLAQAWSNIAGQDAAVSARNAASRALELDPGLADSHVAMAAVHGREWNWTASEAESRRALELNPNSLDACGCYSLDLARMGRFPEAIALAERMVTTNPLASTSYAVYGYALYVARRSEEAAVRLRRALELDADNLQATYYLSRNEIARGRPEEALKLLSGRQFEDQPILALAYAAAGRRAEALRIVQVAAASASPDIMRIAYVYAALGDNDRSIEWLTRALDARLGSEIAVEPALDPVRSDPRFKALVARLNFPPN